MGQALDSLVRNKGIRVFLLIYMFFSNIWIKSAFKMKWLSVAGFRFMVPTTF